MNIVSVMVIWKFSVFLFWVLMNGLFLCLSCQMISGLSRLLKGNIRLMNVVKWQNIVYCWVFWLGVVVIFLDILFMQCFFFGVWQVVLGVCLFGQCGVLKFEQFLYVLLGQFEYGVQFGGMEWCVFGGFLYFDEVVGIGYYYVQVGFCGGIFQVVQVEDWYVLVDIYGNGGDYLFQWIVFECVMFFQYCQGVDQCYGGVGD